MTTGSNTTLSAQLFSADGDFSSRPPDALSLLALAFLGAPVLIFLVTWLKPAYAAVGVALIAMALGSVARRFHYNWPTMRFGVTAIVIVVSLIWAAMGGGSHFVYANPDWLVRDAVLGDLTFSDWPPSYGFREGHHDLLRAAIGLFLPVAAAAKIFGQNALPTLMFIWTSLGVLIFLLLLPLPQASLHRLLIALSIVIAFSGMDILGVLLLHGQYPVFPLRIEWWNEFNFRAMFSYTSLTGQLIWAPNHALPMWIATALFYRHWKHADFVPLLCLLLPTLSLHTPFALPGLAPFLILALVDRVRSRINPRDIPITAIVAALIIGGLILRLQMLDTGTFSVQPSATTTAPEQRDALAFAKNYLVFILMEFAILGVVLIGALRHSKGLLLIALCVLAVLPIITLGPTNDLLLRVSTPSLVLLAILCQRVVANASVCGQPRAVLLAALLIVGAHTPFNELWRAATWKAWRPDYLRPFVATQSGGLPVHYIGRLNDPLLMELLRTPHRVPDRQQRMDTSENKHSINEP